MAFDKGKALLEPLDGLDDGTERRRVVGRAVVLDGRRKGGKACSPFPPFAAIALE